jgi:hypothetical protein
VPLVNRDRANDQTARSAVRADPPRERSVNFVGFVSPC